MTADQAPIPRDDGRRDLTVADPDDPTLTHLAVVGDTYTILVTGEQTAGRYALIDMLVPDGGGPPPHRHDFEEMFHVLDGEIEITLREATSVAAAGQTVNIPANVAHAFRNASGGPARLLCMVAPAGLEAYFAEFGAPVASRTSPPPATDDAAMAERMAKAAALASQYRIEIVGGEQ